jgi:hypothetical protein
MTNKAANISRIFLNWKFLFFMILLICAVVYGAITSYFNRDPIPRYDQEMYSENGKILTPSTQSLNRYTSVIREFTKPVSIAVNDSYLSLNLSNPNGDLINFEKIDLRYIVPMLPYSMKQADEFDYANLMLGEFSRNAVALSYQENNELFGYFNASNNVFNSDDDYLMNEDGTLAANSRVRPLRFSVTNNCLGTGLWELSASDSAGEIYHSWFDMPRSTYYGMIRSVNDLDLNDIEMFDSLRYKKDLSDVEVDLDRLRIDKGVLLDVATEINAAKEVGGYSTQDSRRKVQNKYFEVFRSGDKVTPEIFYDLAMGDMFKLRKFVPPGIYSSDEKVTIPFNPYWNKVQIKDVTPLTQYPGGKAADDSLGYIEITAYNDDMQKVVVVGNVPVSLLVEQQDYFVPAFGVGVLMPSERIERRYLRLKDGPVPHYAYMMSKNDDDKWSLVNNHEVGIEQLTIRPIVKGGKTYLRINLIAYERILDLIEMEVPITGSLAKRIEEATAKYTPPLYRVYKDDNII